MIRVIATFMLESKNVQEAIELATELVESTRKEYGCVQYDLLQAEEAPSQLVILEGWETQADLDAHEASEHFTNLVPQLAALCLQLPGVIKYSLVI